MLLRADPTTIFASLDVTSVLKVTHSDLGANLSHLDMPHQDVQARITRGKSRSEVFSQGAQLSTRCALLWESAALDHVLQTLHGSGTGKFFTLASYSGKLPNFKVAQTSSSSFAAAHTRDVEQCRKWEQYLHFSVVLSRPTQKVAEPVMARAFEAVNILGFTEKFVHFSRTPMSMPCLLSIMEGSLHVVIGKIKDLAGVAAAESTLQEKQSTQDPANANKTPLRCIYIQMSQWKQGIAQKEFCNVCQEDVKGKEATAVSETEISAILAKLNQQSLDELIAKHGVKLHHAVLVPGSMLYIPGACFVASCCRNGESAWGFRTSFLHVLGEQTKENMQFLREWDYLKKSSSSALRADWFFAGAALDASAKAEADA
eukprot:4786421-Amphidinium_carterae.3